jgi:hypothetical protein
MKNVIQSATRGVSVTPSDSTTLQFKRLFVGGAGNVVIELEGSDTPLTFTGVPAGTYLDVSGRRVKAATTATNIVALDW